MFFQDIGKRLEEQDLILEGMLVLVRNVLQVLIQNMRDELTMTPRRMFAAELEP